MSTKHCDHQFCSPYTGERLIGDWFAKTGRRSEIFLATKFMRLPTATSYPPGNPGYIDEQVEKSLQKLRTDYIDEVEVTSTHLHKERSQKTNK